MNQIPLDVYLNGYTYQKQEFNYDNANAFLNLFGKNPNVQELAFTPDLTLPALLSGNNPTGYNFGNIEFTVPMINPFTFISAGKINSTPSISTKASKKSSNANKSQGFFSRVGDAISNGYHKVRDFISNLGQSIISTAAKYLGFKESDGSYKKFTGGRTEAWCADFVTYVTKEAFKRAGKAIPDGFGSPSVSGLRDWAKQKGRYMQTAGKGNKASLIAQNVKPGDIIIFKEAGASHTGIVESIDSNGTIHTIEGNTSDKVARRKYSPNHQTISGFIQMA